MKDREPSEYDRRRAADMAALRFPQKDNVPEDPGYGYQRSLADLIENVIAPGLDDFLGGGNSPDAVEDESLEWLYMHQTAIELRAVSRALEAGNASTDDGHLSRTFTPADAAMLLNVLSRRMVAAAELAARLRVAHYGKVEGGTL